MFGSKRDPSTSLEEQHHNEWPLSSPEGKPGAGQSAGYADGKMGEPVERVIGGGAGLIFKGSGFYETDYVRKSGTPESKEETPKGEGDRSDRLRQRLAPMPPGQNGRPARGWG